MFFKKSTFFPFFFVLSVFYISISSDLHLHINPEDSLSASRVPWPEVSAIPIENEDSVPTGADISFNHGKLYLFYQNNDLFSGQSNICFMELGNGIWSEPITISNSTSPSSSPRHTISGNEEIHLIWGEQATDKSRLEGPSRPGIPDHIFYSNNLQDEWTRTFFCEDSMVGFNVFDATGEWTGNFAK